MADNDRGSSSSLWSAPMDADFPDDVLDLFNWNEVPSSWPEEILSQYNELPGDEIERLKEQVRANLNRRDFAISKVGGIRATCTNGPLAILFVCFGRPIRNSTVRN